MYASEVDGKKRTFFVSGKLWGDSLVMADRETGSEWSHILGEAKQGPSKGKRLTVIPSVITTWSSWLEEHPQTSVVVFDRSADRYSSTIYAKRAPRYGIGLVHEDAARFWRFDRLEQQPLVNDAWQDLQLVVYFDVDTQTPVVWNRQIDRRTLVFEQTDGVIRDTETQSHWNLFVGKATEGPLAGTQLTATSAIISFKNAWDRFHEDSSQWEP